MHELAICQALIDAVTVIANQQRASTVSEIHVSVGPLSGVESALLKSAFSIAAAGTVAKTALLHLHEVPVKILCDSCGTESDAAVNRLVCSHCNNWRTQLISGDELLLQRVCLDREEKGLRNNV